MPTWVPAALVEIKDHEPGDGHKEGLSFPRWIKLPFFIFAFRETLFADSNCHSRRVQERE